MDTKNRQGFFGNWGGAYIPEVLHHTFQELNAEFTKCKNDPAFWQEYVELMSNYSCRPTPLTHAENLSRPLRRGSDLHQTRGPEPYRRPQGQQRHGPGAAGQADGQKTGDRRNRGRPARGGHRHHGRQFGLECTIYMGEEDVPRQRPNVFWMEKLGATVVPVTDGSRTLKDAINEAFRDWVTNMDDTHYVMGTVCGPHPFPEMVAWFQSIIGLEAGEQIMEQSRQTCRPGSSPASAAAPMPWASSRVFLERPMWSWSGWRRAATASTPASTPPAWLARMPRPGLPRVTRPCFSRMATARCATTHSVAAGLDYVGVSPILADLWEKGRVRFAAATDSEVMAALDLTMKSEGIIPALESSHAFVQAFKEAPELSPDEAIIINMSGRGDKDIFTIAHAFDDPSWKEFIIKRGLEYSQDK